VRIVSCSGTESTESGSSFPDSGLMSFSRNRSLGSGPCVANEERKKPHKPKQNRSSVVEGSLHNGVRLASTANSKSHDWDVQSFWFGTWPCLLEWMNNLCRCADKLQQWCHLWHRHGMHGGEQQRRFYAGFESNQSCFTPVFGLKELDKALSNETCASSMSSCNDLTRLRSGGW